MTKQQIERNEAWAAALESGRFKQTTGRLRNVADEFCCLGVACEIYREQTGAGAWQRGFNSSVGFLAAGDKAAEDTAPTAVWSWFGWSDGNPEFPDPDISQVPHAAAVWNDKRGADFPRIARMVRAWLKRQTTESGTEESGVEK